ncbi:MAG: ATP-dependent 6-phosphofructokinase [Candidatus Sericytochromatia bacterium]|nr:ATP-dependent 6-phosphofructokinase [Candidatus Tanganyikabacteria bacterium]
MGGTAIRRIAVMTGGGDAPGLNAVIRGVAKTAMATFGWDVLGVRDGGEGLLASEFQPLSPEHIRGIAARGGTILGTTNRGNPFSYPVTENGQSRLVDRSHEAVENLRRQRIDALVAIGGDGGLRIAHRLAGLGVNVVGVPKTIDNDLLATDKTFGFETAVQTATDALDKIETTAEAHHRVMVVEVMGRDAGWIALHSGIAGSANVILIPEIPFDTDVVATFVAGRRARKKTYTIVVVAEGAHPVGEKQVFLEVDERTGIRRLGGVGNEVGKRIALKTGLETRVTILGHIQRGGSPTAADRVLATRYGVAAAHIAHEGKFDQMVALKGRDITSVPLSEVTRGLKLVEAGCQVVKTARDLGVCFGDVVPSLVATEA